MSWTDGNFTFFSTNKMQSAGMLTFFEWDSDTADYIEVSDYSFDNFFDRDRYNRVELSFGTYTNGIGKCYVHITLPGEVINCVALQNHDFEILKIFVNGATATIIGADTTAAEWDDFAEGNLIVRFASVTAVTVDVYVNNFVNINYIGNILLLDEIYSLPRNPNFSDYKPNLSGLRDSVKLADGGVSTYKTSEKFSADISLNYVPESVATELRNLYATDTAYNFCPYPTTGSGANWDGDIWEVNWVGDYQFLQPAVNDRSVPYYKGKIKLAETPS